MTSIQGYIKVKNVRLKTLIVCLCVFFRVEFGQSQMISGHVMSENENTPLPNAKITFFDSVGTLQILFSDDQGQYTANIKKTGTIHVHCQLNGFVDKKVTLKISDEQDLKLDFYLLPQMQNIELEGITISERSFQSGDLTMTQNQYKIMPASFQDPARILIKYPGFSTPNDGANGIVFRGMAPETNRWQLFGADIVNPNHLSNAGTANDLSTENAGGVNALSGSVLGHYHFEANPADAAKSDVISGVSDMKLAPKIKSFFDLNLIGLEAGLNLASKNENRNTFKNIYTAYRYSFVGLLSQLGVDFGNEKIGYQDFTLNAEVVRSPTVNLNLFGTLGNSSNDFQAVTSADSIKRFKDMQDITFKSNLALGGFQFLWNKKGKAFHHVTIYSQRNLERKENTNEKYLSIAGQPIILFNDQFESLFSTHSFFSQYNDKNDLRIGFRFNARRNDVVKGRVGDPHVYSMIYPYLMYSRKMTNKIHLELGTGSMLDSYSKGWTIEPFAKVLFALSNKVNIETAYRHSSQLMLPSLDLRMSIDNISRVRSHNVQVAMTYGTERLFINSTGFIHFLNHLSNYYLSGSTSNLSHFNIFNGNYLGYDQLPSNGILAFNGYSDGRIFGTSAAIENVLYRNKSHKIYYHINASMYDASYKIPSLDDTWFSGKYNFGYTSSILLSYEKKFSTQTKNKSLILSIANHLRGGQREPKLLSQITSANEIYDNTSSFANSFADYQRIDFRIVYATSSNPKLKHRWSLDIQNLLNRENEGFRYYDRWLKKVILQNQLGLIPVLSYRLEW